MQAHPLVNSNLKLEKAVVGLYLHSCSLLNSHPWAEHQRRSFYSLITGEEKKQISAKKKRLLFYILKGNLWPSYPTSVAQTLKFLPVNNKMIQTHKISLWQVWMGIFKLLKDEVLLRYFNMNCMMILLQYNDTAIHCEELMYETLRYLSEKSGITCLVNPHTPPTG